MTKEEIARLERAVEDARVAEAAARDTRGGFERELTAARITYADANPHPWHGKRVWRFKRFGYRGKTQRKEGTVTAYDPAKHKGLRELSLYRITPGEPIVVLDSGVTGWTLTQHKNWSDELQPGETDWALVEEQE